MACFLKNCGVVLKKWWRCFLTVALFWKEWWRFLKENGCIFFFEKQGGGCLGHLCVSLSHFYESYCFSMSMALGNFMGKKFMINLWMVIFYETNATTLYTSWACINIKGWLLYVVWRRYCKGCKSSKAAALFMKIRNISWDAWIGERNTERKSLNILIDTTHWNFSPSFPKLRPFPSRWDECILLMPSCVVDEILPNQPAMSGLLPNTQVGHTTFTHIFIP